MNSWTLKQTLFLRAFGLLKVPLIAFVRPTVVELSDKRCVIRIPLSRRTKNHLGSMYFGALSIGADCAGGLIAATLIRKRKARMQLVFKSFRADFLKRPESDVYFVCEEGAKIHAQFERALQSGVRQNEGLRIHGRVKNKSGGYDTVAEFTVALSLKRK